MGFWDWVKGQFIDVIEWLDDSHDILVYRFERYGNEIKYGAKLIVRPGQVAIFVSEGKIGDIFKPGTYVLETKNLPILTSLQHWDHGFNSPFKAEVYFISTARFTNLKWGTKGQIVIPDPTFGTVPIRAYGSYEIRVKDPVKFLREVVGTDGLFTTDEIKGQLNNLIASNLPKAIGEFGISVRELAFHYRELGEKVREYLQSLFENYGLNLEQLVIENVSLPDRIVKAIEERVSQNIIGNLDNYIKYKMAEGLEKGGDSSSIVGMGVAMGMASQMGKLFGGDGKAGVTGQSTGTGWEGGGAGISGQPGVSQPGITQSRSIQPETSQSGLTPPPPPGAESYYIAKGSKTFGPYSVNTLREMVLRGEINGDTYIWKPGMGEWKRLQEVKPELLPPPPPPPPGGPIPPFNR